jgi:hypothetical protein
MPPCSEGVCAEDALKECRAAPYAVRRILIDMVHRTLRALDNEMLFRSYSRRLDRVNIG